MADTWCPLPWIFQAIRNNGDLRVCCQANSSGNRGILRKTDGSAFNARSDDLDEARNAPLIKEIRLAMLRGEEHPSCVRCQREDTAGIRSRRVYERENWAHHFDRAKARDLTGEDGSIDTREVNAVYYDIRLGNHCNLKCRMCGPTDSSSWYRDQIEVWGDRFWDSHGEVELVKADSGTIVPRNRDYEWTDSPRFWEQVEKNIPHIRHIHTVGGEPFLIARHFDLLEKCVEMGAAKDIVVEYNSNLTVIPERAWELWRNFRLINIGVSLDGVGPVNEFIRHPSRWSAITANLARLDRAEGRFRAWIATTVQAYNILHLPEILKWKLESRFQRINRFETQPLITTHPLHNPRHLNAKILPPSYKRLVAERFEAFHPWLEGWMASEALSHEEKDNYRRHARKLLDGYKEYMLAEDWTSELPKFWEYSCSLDRLRKESLGEILPELAESVGAWLKSSRFSPACKSRSEPPVRLSRNENG